MIDEIKQEGSTRDVEEKDLFYGADSKNTCYDICTNNFEFRTNSKSSTLYGEGSYFSVNANYSHRHTMPSQDGERYIIRTKVLAGISTTGHSTYRRPPPRSGQTHKLFDSCVDNTDVPNIYVIFDRCQCYPEYMISYKEKRIVSATST